MIVYGFHPFLVQEHAYLLASPASFINASTSSFIPRSSGVSSGLGPSSWREKEELSSASVALAASTRVTKLSIMILCVISSFELPSPPHPVLLSLIIHILSVAANAIHG